MLGKYINDIGCVPLLPSPLLFIYPLQSNSPQTIFVLPAGILHTSSPNTLALSLWSLDPSGASLDGLELVADGAFSTGFHIADLQGAPGYDEQKARRPAAMGMVKPM